MATMQKQISIWLAVLGVVLGVAAAAQAQGLNIALTVLVQESITETSPNIYEYKTTTLRVTQKDVLDRLAAYYVFPEGSILDCNGDFLLINPTTGAVLHTVSFTYLDLVTHSSVQRGRSDNNPGGRGNVRHSAPVDVNIHVGMMIFDLHGLSQGTYVFSSTGATDAYSYTLQGGGIIDGKNCTVTGKMKFKIPVL